MKVVFDNIVFSLQRYGGISVVWQELLKRIQPIDDVRYIDVDVSKTINESRGKLNIPDSEVVSKIKYPKIERYLPVHIKDDEPFIFHSSYYRYCTNPNAINITTVHDFTYEYYVKGIKQKVHSWQKSTAIRHSNAIVCISENTKRDLLRFIPDIDESKIHVIYNGVSETYKVLNENVSDSQLPFPAKSYVVFMGRREDPYKNFELAARAVSATDLNLLVIGSGFTASEEQLLSQLMSSSRYLHLNYLADERLNVVLNHAAALVYPSSYEGFGIPILEAQKAGCPVIALKASSIPEVIGETPLLMDEPTERCMVEKLRLLNNASLMKEVLVAGLANASRFSWDSMAQQYLELYSENK